jgi:hypothetical protein
MVEAARAAIHPVWPTLPGASSTHLGVADMGTEIVNKSKNKTVGYGRGGQLATVMPMMSVQIQACSGQDQHLSVWRCRLVTEAHLDDEDIVIREGVNHHHQGVVQDVLVPATTPGWFPAPTSTVGKYQGEAGEAHGASRYRVGAGTVGQIVLEKKASLGLVEGVRVLVHRPGCVMPGDVVWGDESVRFTLYGLVWARES